jgi:CheY-like chemotaxis protein
LPAKIALLTEASRVPTMLTAKQADSLIQQLTVLIVDDNQYMRKMLRGILLAIGVKGLHEAEDGISGLELVRTLSPDVVILDWEMPLLNGPEFLRIVRSPGVFPTPNLPIIMLSGYCERWRVVEAARLGVNEYLCKPVSQQALYERLLLIVASPRASVRIGEYYGPQPRTPVLLPAGRTATS